MGALCFFSRPEVFLTTFLRMILRMEKIVVAKRRLGSCRRFVVPANVFATTFDVPAPSSTQNILVRHSSSGHTNGLRKDTSRIGRVFPEPRPPRIMPKELPSTQQTKMRGVPHKAGTTDGTNASPRTEQETCGARKLLFFLLASPSKKTTQGRATTTARSHRQGHDRSASKFRCLSATRAYPDRSGRKRKPLVEAGEFRSVIYLEVINLPRSKRRAPLTPPTRNRCRPPAISRGEVEFHFAANVKYCTYNMPRVGRAIALLRSTPAASASPDTENTHKSLARQPRHAHKPPKYTGEIPPTTYLYEVPTPCKESTNGQQGPPLSSLKLAPFPVATQTNPS